MPIRPERKHLYPADWRQIRDEVIARDRRACKFCGLVDRDFCLRWKDGRDPVAIKAETYDEAFEEACRLFPEDFNPYDDPGDPPPEARIVHVVLTVAHLDHDPTNNGEPGNRPNLAALCQRCHLLHDVDEHKASAAITRDKKAGQLRFEDL